MDVRGNLEFDTPPINSGLGTINLIGTAGGTTLTLNGNFDNNGDINSDNGPGTVNTLVVQDGDFTNNGTISAGGSDGEFRIDGNAVNNAAINIQGGTFVYEGSQPLDSTTGQFNVDGTAEIASGLIVDPSSIVGATFTGDGTVFFTSPSATLTVLSDFTFGAGTPDIDSDGFLTIEGPGTFINQRDDVILDSDLVVNTNVVNQATITVEAGGVTQVNGGFDNQGSLVLEPGADLFVAAGILNSEGATVSGSGTISIDDGTFFNEGTIAPGASPGNLTIDGNFSFNDGVLDLELGGTEPLNDNIIVNGFAAMNDGLIRFSFSDGFLPTAAGAPQVFMSATNGFEDSGNISVAIEGVAEGFMFVPLDFSGTSSPLDATTDAVASPGSTLLFGSGRDDVFDGGDGNDVLTGGGGDDDLQGSAGTDTAVFSGNFADYTVDDSTPGILTVAHLGGVGADGTDTLQGIETARFADGDYDVASATFNSGPLTAVFTDNVDDDFVGTAGDDQISIVGTAKDDINESDSIDGGDGFDEVLINGAGDQEIALFNVELLTAAGETIDLINTPDDMNVDGAGVVNLLNPGSVRISGGGEINAVTGSTVEVIDNTAVNLNGEFGSVTLIGGGGDDVIFGGKGGDELTGGGGADTFIYTATSQFDDNINDFNPLDDGFAVEDKFSFDNGSGGVLDLERGQLNNLIFESVEADGVLQDDTKIVTVTDIVSNFSSATDVAAELSDLNGGFLGSDSTMVFAVGDGSDSALWYWDDLSGNGDGSISFDELSKIAELHGLDAASLAAGNFEGFSDPANTINITFTAGEGNDSFAGGGGDDNFFASGLAEGNFDTDTHDVVDGGGGFDSLFLDDGGLNVLEVRNMEFVRGGDGSDFLNLLDGQDHTLTVENIEVVNARNGIDIITVGAGDDGGGLTAHGNAGNDIIVGGNGDDVVSGGSGVDTLTLGAGDDTFRYFSTFDYASGADTFTDFTVGGAEDSISFGNSALLASRASGDSRAVQLVNPGGAIDPDAGVVILNSTGNVSDITSAAQVAAALQTNTGLDAGDTFYFVVSDGVNGALWRAADISGGGPLAGEHSQMANLLGVDDPSAFTADDFADFGQVLSSGPVEWLGVSSSDFFDDANWDTGVAPSDDSQVTINAPLSNFPLASISSGISIFDSITVDGGTLSLSTATVELDDADGGGLLAMGTTVGSVGTVSIVSSDLSTTGDGNGTLVGGNGTGTLSVSSLGSLTTGSLTVGSGAGGIGSANVSGAGSTIVVDGVGANIVVGQDGTGQLNVTGGAGVLLDGGTSLAQMLLGNGDGTGTVNVIGSQFDIAGEDVLVQVRNNSSILLDDGATMTVEGTNEGTFEVGPNFGDDASVFIHGGSTLMAGDSMSIGDNLGSATVSLQDSSTLEADSILIGGGESGSGTLSIANSTVTSVSIGVFDRGVIDGFGTINGDVTLNSGSTIGATGAEATTGQLDIFGDLSFEGGILAVNIDSLSNDLITVSGTATLNSLLMDISFDDFGAYPTLGEQFTVIQAGSLAGSGLGAYVVHDVADGFFFTPTGVAGDMVLTAGATAVFESGTDLFVGSDANEAYSAGDGNDVFTGGGGDDVFDGADGTDIARYSGNFAEYTIGGNVSSSSVNHVGGSATDGSDLLFNIETLQFANGTYDVATAEFTAGSIFLDFNAQSTFDANDGITEGDDHLVAIGLSQSGDTVDGLGGLDTLQLEQGSNVLTLTNVETILGSAGNDVTSFANLLTNGMTVNLGDGTDQVGMAAGVNTLALANVEQIFRSGPSSDDTLNLTQSVSGLTVSMNLGTDTLNLADGGSTVEVNSVEFVNGGDGIDFVTATGNDAVTFTGGGGNDDLTGSFGADTAVYSGNRADYVISGTVSSATVAHTGGSQADGTDDLSNIETLQFADGTYDVATAQFTQQIVFTAGTDTFNTSNGFSIGDDTVVAVGLAESGDSVNA